MSEHGDLSREEREFLSRADADGRVFTTGGDRYTIQQLQSKGLIEQNVFWGSCYWVKDQMPK